MDDVAVTLPRWVRLIFAFLAVDFAILCLWLAGMDPAGWGPVAGAILSGAVAVLLLVTSTTGRIPKWMWLLPWIPGD